MARDVCDHWRSANETNPAETTRPHFCGTYLPIDGAEGAVIRLDWDENRGAYIETDTYVIAGETRTSRVAISPERAGYMIATGWRKIA